MQAPQAKGACAGGAGQGRMCRRCRRCRPRAHVQAVQAKGACAGAAGQGRMCRRCKPGEVLTSKVRPTAEPGPGSCSQSHSASVRSKQDPPQRHISPRIQSRLRAWAGVEGDGRVALQREGQKPALLERPGHPPGKWTTWGLTGARYNVPHQKDGPGVGILGWSGSPRGWGVPRAQGADGTCAGHAGGTAWGPERGGCRKGPGHRRRLLGAWVGLVQRLSSPSGTCAPPRPI